MKRFFCLGFGKRFFRGLGWKGVLCGAGVWAGLMGGGRRAEGVITLQETVEPIDAGLAAAGWEGIKVTLVADAAGETVAGIDLRNRVGPSVFIDFRTSIGTLQDVDSIIGPGEAIGISGPTYQTWNMATDDCDGSTPTGKLGEKGGGSDSYFLNSGKYFVADEFAEDLVEPVDGVEGKLEGAGSLMTFSGAVPTQKQTVSMDIAFLIVPAGMGNVYFRGTAVDSNDYEFGFDQVLNAAVGDGSAAPALMPAVVAVPEAGTIGVGVVIAGMVLRRRRGKL